MNNNGTRLAVRLAPAYELQLRMLVERTIARTRADVIRCALRALRTCWAMKRRADRLEVRRIVDGRLEALFALQPYAGTGGGHAASGRYDYTLQLRLGPEDNAVIGWLRARDAAPTRSSVIRLAIAVLSQLQEYAARGLGVVARLGMELVPVDVPLLEHTKPGTPSLQAVDAMVAQQAEPRDLLALGPHERLGFSEIKRLHMVYPWRSVLVKLDTLYDDSAFLDVVENHLWHGTKLYYVLRDKEALVPLARQLSRRTGHLHLRCQEFVHVIPVGDEDYPDDEFVVLNFLNESPPMRGYMWHWDGSYGVLASEDELITLTKEFRKAAEAEDSKEVLVFTEQPLDERVAVRVHR